METEFPIHTDFFTSQRKLIYANEYRAKVPSNIMWALLLYVHPRSAYFNLELSTRRQLLKKELIKDPNFNFDDYEATLSLMKEHSMSVAESYMTFIDKKVRERKEFMDSVPYNANTYEMLDKMMKEGYPMMKQLKEIKKDFDSEVSSQTEGQEEESLLEKGLLRS